MRADQDAPHPAADQFPPVAQALARCVDQGILVLADDVIAAVNAPFVRIFGAVGDNADALVGETAEAVMAREPYRAAGELWAGRHTDHGRRVRCALPGDRLIEGRWHRLPTGTGGRLMAAVVGDVTEELEVRRRLRQHNRALAEVVATKTELVTALLHELRTPLTAALGMMDLLPETVGDELLDDALPLIGRKLRRIEQVTAEIGVISGIETGKVALERAEFDVPALLAEVGSQTGVAVVARPSSGVVVGDRARLEQVFRRLIAAVRAVGGPGDRMSAELTGERWRITMALPERQATDRLFTTAADSGGNATALMLARAVVARHGGSVGVESVDGSSQLTVWLSC